MTKNKIAVVVSILTCIALSIGLVVTTANSTAIVQEKDSEINNLNSTNADLQKNIADAKNEIANLTSQTKSQQEQIQNLTEQNTLLTTETENLQKRVDAAEDKIFDLTLQTELQQEQIKNLTQQNSLLQNEIEVLQKQVNDLTATINASKTSKLKTLVFHACEKGEGYQWGRLPDANYTYNQILTLNNGTYEVLLLPEYKGNENWTETSAWIKTNFQQIPIMLPVFEGGNKPDNTPILQLSPEQISETIATAKVQWLRIAEMVSWYLEHPNLTFPTQYVRSILDFARAHGLRVQWGEWKINDNVFQRVKNYTAGYEDIVTVTFQTNSGDAEPADGFLSVSTMFPHWGGGVQSWYWVTRDLGNETDMPASLLIEHALSAKNMGAEMLQLEPYWYFFNNGEPMESLKLLMAMLT